ncbi:hypothetical protein A0H81_04312 [Grifola frondosa]|uniref:Carbohydrate esterase family 16 protein n=1 Tax=Grifola frondosa TaxID=5627 RepID=A0A1C7MG82_GRIFR|nr:hypothetical protein A0H81_04312 [Grifola frondosa]
MGGAWRTQLVYDYALGGDGVDGVRRQILQEFIPSLGGQPDWAPWTASDTLFITWVGINDCAFVAVEEIPPLVSKLFDLHDRLYDVGARNFMLVNLPPIQRSPAAGQSRGKSPYQLWNDSLRETAEQFAASHKPATILIYSSWDTFTRVLDNPATFGFKQEDSLKNGGAIWVDHLHPTSRMHDIIACDMANFWRR